MANTERYLEDLPKMKKYIDASVKPMFKAWEQMMDVKIAAIKEELREEYEERITILESKVTALEEV